MKHLPDRRKLLLATGASGIAVLMAGCSTPPPARVAVAVEPPVPEAAPPPPPPAEPIAVAPEPLPTKVSAALTPRDYRRDAAGHLYVHNNHRIFKGKMPPLLHAVGVLQVEVDGMGEIVSTSWMRAPTHAPDVIREIIRTVRAAAPFPAPVRMGRVTYTDTWLWHKSGKFQLDTLTEGQT